MKKATSPFTSESLDLRYNRMKAIRKGTGMIFHVKLESAEDGWVVAECPALPGCVSQGRDEAEALVNIREAIIAWLWAEDQKALQALSHSPDYSPVVVTV